jgi:broad specificity phosphatase PhoE
MDEAGSMTVVVLLRHADVGAPPRNNVLNTKGKVRAAQLVHVLGDAGVDAVFASEFPRAQMTAAPLAEHLGVTVEVRSAHAPEALAAEILADHAGGTVVVVSHSNVVPAVIAGLGGPHLPDLPEDEFDNLFWVNVHPDDGARVHHLRYGAGT